MGLRMNLKFDELVRTAVKHFWTTRSTQGKKQGAKTGRKDSGTRAEATGGAQMDGFIELVRSIIVEVGISRDAISFEKGRVELPGYFRAEKQWDTLVIVDRQLIAALEFKSHVGPSFGNNLNNRTEEAVGSGLDLRLAYRDGAFEPASAPWMGYWLLLEDCEAVKRPVRVKEPHFSVFEDFKGATYLERYQLMTTKLVRERLYDAACLICSPKSAVTTGNFSVPSEELSVHKFCQSLVARAIATTK